MEQILSEPQSEELQAKPVVPTVELDQTEVPEVIPSPLSDEAAETNVDQATKDKRALEAVKEFIECLIDTFRPKRQTPLGRYNRIVPHIQPGDVAVDKVLKGFKSFFINNPDTNSVDKETVINYGRDVNIPIGKLLQSDERDTIKRWLQEIRFWVIGDVKRPQPEGVAESGFVDSLIKDVGSTIQNISADNPSDAIRELMQNGFIEGVIGQIDKGVKTGQLDVQKLAGALKGAAPDLLRKGMMETGQDDAEMEKVIRQVKRSARRRNK